MIAQEIPYSKLPDAVRIAFSEDKDVYALYDPTVIVNSLDDIVLNITNKLSEGNLTFLGVYEQGRLVGYFAYDANKSILVSFALNVAYRQRKYLKEFYALIRKEIGKFDCFLFQKNLRAIKWLQKQGMKAVAFNNLILKLTCR